MLSVSGWYQQNRQQHCEDLFRTDGMAMDVSCYVSKRFMVMLRRLRFNNKAYTNEMQALFKMARFTEFLEEFVANKLKQRIRSK